MQGLFACQIKDKSSCNFHLIFVIIFEFQPVDLFLCAACDDGSVKGSRFRIPRKDWFSDVVDW